MSQGIAIINLVFIVENLLMVKNVFLKNPPQSNHLSYLPVPEFVNKRLFYNNYGLIEIPDTMETFFVKIVSVVLPYEKISNPKHGAIGKNIECSCRIVWTIWVQINYYG